MSRAERVVLRRDGVPISSLALGWRNILSSKSPFASMLISYSLSRALLNRGGGADQTEGDVRRHSMWTYSFNDMNQF